MIDVDARCRKTKSVRWRERDSKRTFQGPQRTAGNARGERKRGKVDRQQKKGIIVVAVNATMQFCREPCLVLLWNILE